MTTMQIQINDSAAAAIRLKAQQEGKSPEEWVADVAVQRLQPVTGPANGHWVDRFLEAADKAGGDSGGWKWNRDELYDE